VSQVLICQIPSPRRGRVGFMVDEVAVGEVSV